MAASPAPHRFSGVADLSEEDPELLAGVPKARRAAAAQAARARVLAWEPGDLVAFPDAAVAPGGLGLLVLEGCLAVRFKISEHPRAEILGAGDLTRPWLELGSYVAPTADVEWTPLTAVRLAVLDRAFAQRVAPFPEIADELIARVMLRTRRLHLQMIATAQRAIDDRLLLMLWLLAERWGTVGPDGVRLHLPITHRLLADLVGSRRPSASTAIGHLRERGLVSSPRRGELTLHGDPPIQDLQVT